jgi:hypothetical protein
MQILIAHRIIIRETSLLLRIATSFVAGFMMISAQLEVISNQKSTFSKPHYGLLAIRGGYVFKVRCLQQCTH